MIRAEIANNQEIKAALRNMPDTLFNQVREALQDATLKADAEVKDNLRSKLNVRSGTLRRSIKPLVTGMSLDELKAGLVAVHNLGGKEVAYAPIHEAGGTIKAKSAYAKVPGGPYLNIPTSGNLTASGVMRLPAREVFARGGYLARTRSGWGVFLNGQMMFALKRQVTIPARLGMQEALENQVPTLLDNLRKMKL